VTSVKNPVLAARLVMERTPHILIQGPEATELARRSGLEMCTEDYFVTEHRVAQLQATQAVEGGQAVVLDHGQAGVVPSTTKMGTVGAVVRDSHGSLAGLVSCFHALEISLSH
jgi:beta-aspartyl-peptidase (threonine type)